MKQYWRVGTIRTLASLALGMLVLGRLYYGYIPVLNDWGLMGALTLGSVLVLIFMALGWFYDARARMWSAAIQAATERKPYSYVPTFHDQAIDYPIFYVLLSIYHGITEKIGSTSKNIRDLAGYLDEYFSMVAEKSDIQGIQLSSEHFIQEHPLDGREENGEISALARLKLGWEVQTLRLTWIQSLTGLLQDVLVFGSLYVLVVFPWVPRESELIVAIGGISLPLLVVLVGLGWYYDRKLRVWSVDMAVKVERDPYSYVMEPKLYAFTLPFIYALLAVMKELLENAGAGIQEILTVAQYLEAYSKLDSSNNEDLKRSIQLRRSLPELFTSDAAEEKINGD